ncbi:MAG: glycosyltransferase [Kiritimatiellae bacterium]|nr:glycosyltransferase [Kiritimatiellia bacterium]
MVQDRAPMKICWWTVYPTVNQSAMLTALRARGVDVEACYFGKYDAYRGLLAWRERPLEPWEHHASTIAAARAAVPDWAERIQMVSSFADGISWRVMLWCWWHGRPWFAMTEGSRARWFVRPALRLFAWFVNRDARMGFFFGRTASEQFGAYGVQAEKRAVCTYVLPDLPAELPPRDEAFTFVYAGVLLALKAVDVIAEAFRRVHEEFPHVRLLVVGDGKLKTAFDGIDGVELVGPVPPGDVCRYLARGHVVLQPSRRDGWGLALLEGAACGLAMIGSDKTRSAVDRIVDGVNGFRVPAGDVTALAEAMLRYAADPGLATRHGAEARKAVLDMSGAVQADLFINTLRRRCGSRLAGGPVKILHVMPGAEDPANGIAVAVRRLAEEQRARGAEVSVAEACSLDDCRAVDVVFVHSMWLPSVMRACRTALRAGTPLVRMPHGCLNPAALRHSAWKKALVSPLERRYMRRAACVLVTTETEKAAVERWVRGVRRVEVVGMGVDDLLSPDLPSKRTDDGPKTFLFVGRLHPLKGLDLLLAALPAGALLRVIAPDGGRQAHYERLARQLGVADRVTFLGVKTGAEKIAEMRRADALVLPTHSENFGFAVAEALVVGTPAITTKGAPWEGLETHGCGWWTDVDAAALRAALADCAARTRGELAEMGARGRAWMLGDLTWRSCAARVQDAICGITNHEPRTANCEFVV